MKFSLLASQINNQEKIVSKQLIFAITLKDMFTYTHLLQDDLCHLLFNEEKQIQIKLD